MDEFIDAILEDHPDLTTRELNRLLRRQFCTYLSKGRISYGEDFIDLPSYMTDTLNANDRQAWIKAHPFGESQLGQIQIKEFGTVQEQQSVGHYVRKSTISKEAHETKTVNGKLDKTPDTRNSIMVIALSVNNEHVRKRYLLSDMYLTDLCFDILLQWRIRLVRDGTFQ